jgi:ABC-type phosphate/phosphonate transport system substrate-binding protein
MALLKLPHYGGAILVALAVLALSAAPDRAGDPKGDVLHIGASGTLTKENGNGREKANLETLRSFIKDETGLDNDITTEKDGWQAVLKKMEKGDYQLGVFQGYEYVWASAKQPELKPLALSVNVHVYPVVYMVVKKDSPAKKFKDLKGKTLSLPATGQRYLTLYVTRPAELQGKKLNEFFKDIQRPDNVEDALDSVFQGKVAAAVVDQAALEAYKSRKPGRFKGLKEVAKSDPFPPVLIAYFDNKLDPARRRKFLDGLLGAHKKERGEQMLTLFHLTSFDPVRDDFPQVVEKTRKNYPPPKEKE